MQLEIYQCDLEGLPAAEKSINKKFKNKETYYIKIERRNQDFIIFIFYKDNGGGKCSRP
ncbi:MAG: hypothetical protein GTO02_13620 [Candidatus Dadabacteria bacterium]|nr:hypothetical protein [Candidatus Dadabacteria bacterium]